jgi:hypothetical protein
MSTLSKIFLLFILILCFSCEDKGIIVKCEDCLSEEPINTTLDVKLDLSDYGFLPALITVYEGNIEDSVVYDSFSVNSETTSITVSINKKYTVTATYYIPDDYYIAVDSATPKVRYEKSQCSDPCYFVYDKSINLRLKYTK